jgi:hypothetical protein
MRTLRPPLPLRDFAQLPGLDAAQEVPEQSRLGIVRVQTLRPRTKKRPCEIPAVS